MKCGTTSLHHYLDLHPEIQMSSPKELKFFIEQSNWTLGLDWYASHFRPDVPIRGESSPQYTDYPNVDGVPARMRSVVPDAKLVYVVRDPIERLLSQYVHYAATGEERRPLAETLSSPRYIDRSRYWTQLERYLEHYPADRIHVATCEDLRSRRRETMRGIFGFLGVDEDFDSPQFERVWETSKGKNRKYRALERVRRLPLLRRSHRLPQDVRWALERIKYSPLGGQVEPPPLDAALRRDLADRLRPEADRLREFVGRELEGWSV
jgi:hypothetical protein